MAAAAADPPGNHPKKDIFAALLGKGMKENIFFFSSVSNLCCPI
jgi:hypothetical protein